MSAVFVPSIRCDGFNPAENTACDARFQAQGGDSITYTREIARARGWRRARRRHGFVDLCPRCGVDTSRQRGAARPTPRPTRPRPPETHTVALPSASHRLKLSPLALAHLVADGHLSVRMSVPYRQVPSLERAMFKPIEVDRLAEIRDRADITEYDLRYPVRLSNTDGPTALGILLRKAGL